MKALLLGLAATAFFAPVASASENWLGITFQYTPDRDGDVNAVDVEITGKVEINDFLSVHPVLNTSTELGASLALDKDITSKLEVWGGAGIMKRLDVNAVGAVTGNDNNVIPYVEAGVALDLTKNVGTYAIVRSPFSSGEGKELTIGSGIKWNF